MYQADVTQNVAPASASPASMIRASEIKTNMTTAALNTAAQTGFDVFRGYQEEGFRQGITGELNALQADVDLVKMDDTELKADWAKAEAEGTIDNPLLQQFRDRQQRIVEARNTLPQRYKEFMLRSEAELKAAISRYPGLADAFRSIAGEVTGKQGLELYSVTNLYEEIGFIEKMNEAEAKARAKVEEDALKRFINDAKGDLGETGAAALYGRLSPREREMYVLGTVEERRALENLRNAVEANGEEFLNSITHLATVYDLNMMLANGKAMDVLKDAGITQADILAGNFTPEMLDNPQVKQAVMGATNKLLALATEFYENGLKTIADKSDTQLPSEARRKARESLQQWYDRTRKELENGGSVLATLQTFASNDPKAIQDKRLDTIRRTGVALGIPMEVVGNLMSLDPAIVNTQIARNPQWAQQLKYLSRLTSVALTNGTHTEFYALQSELGKYLGGMGATPTTDAQAAASVISYETLKHDLRNVVTGVSGVEDAGFKVSNFVRNALTDPSTARKFLDKDVGIAQSVISKLPESERKLVIDSIKTNYTDAVYSSLTGHGYLAQQVFQKLTDRFTYEVSENGLALVVKETPATLEEASQGLVNDAIIRREMLRTAQSFNKYSSAVDNAIRVRAAITGEDVLQLRKEFINSVKGTVPVAEAVTAPVAPRNATMAEVIRFANENNIPLQEAVKQLNDSGYTVD
jgi:hypothetical protein